MQRSFAFAQVSAAVVAEQATISVPQLVAPMSEETVPGPHWATGCGTTSSWDADTLL
ncbi:MAG: hypothetical protein ACOC1F_08525 [Myxococcota bacterium]